MHMQRKMLRVLAMTATLGALGLLITGCPAPITAAILSKHKDGVGPRVTITSPADGSSYPATVVVTGTASDTADASGTPGEIAALRYDLAPATIPGADITSTLKADGTFSFQFATTSFSGTMVLTMTSTDWNGNKGSVSVTLVNQGAIPSFVPTQGNHSVSLSWNPVPLSSRYTLYYTTNGSIPSITNGTPMDNVTSPLSISGLANGSLCVFLLQSHSTSGADNWSAPVKAIPLSTFTLAPRVQGQYGQIRVEWNAIPAAVGFEVWRSTTRGAGFSNISGTLAGTNWVDSGVSDGKVYYYQVRPSLAGSAMSEAAGGQTIPFAKTSAARIGSANPAGTVERVAVQGNYVYAASQGFYFQGLQIYDVSDPRHPVLAGELSLGADCYGVAVQGSYAYVGDTAHRLSVVNVSDPRNPVLVGSPIATAGPVWSATVSGSYLYLACDSVQRFDISNPALPSSPVSYDPGESASGITVSGAFVYVAAFTHLRILSTSNMQLVGSLAGIGHGRDVAVGGNDAYVADEVGQLWVVDVSNKAAPVTAAPALWLGTSAKTVALAGFTVCIAGDFSVGQFPFKMINVQNPAQPTLIAGINLPYQSEGMAISGSHAFVGNLGYGLQVVDLKNPSAPQLSGSISLSGTIDTVQDGERVFALSSGNTMMVLDLTDPSAPATLGTFPTASMPRGAAVSGHYVFIQESGGTEVVDISNTAAPVSKGLFPLGGGSRIVIGGDYAFLVGSGYILETIDISDPLHPVVVGTCPTNSSTISIALQGSYAYVGEMTGSPATRFEVIDVSAPSLPRVVGSCIIPDQVNDVVVSGIDAYLAVGGTIGLSVVDITNPQFPTLRSSTVGMSGSNVSAAGDWVLLDDSSSSTIHVFNVSDPTSIQQVGQVVLPWDAVSARFGGTWASLADYNGGFRTLTLW